MAGEFFIQFGKIIIPQIRKTNMAIIDFYEKAMKKAGQAETKETADSIIFSCVETALIDITQEINILMHVLKERSRNVGSFLEWMENNMSTENLIVFQKLTEMHARNLDIFSEKAREILQDRPGLTLQEANEVADCIQNLSEDYFIENEEPIIFRLLNERMKEIMEHDSI